MSHAQTRPMLANSTPDGGTPHVSTSPPYPVQESAHKRPVEPPVTTTPQKQMPRKPVSYDATHADQSVQAILERRSLLLSPKSAWNALVKAEVFECWLCATCITPCHFRNLVLNGLPTA
jgi:hypothetical protein